MTILKKIQEDWNLAKEVATYNTKWLKIHTAATAVCAGLAAASFLVQEPLLVVGVFAAACLPVAAGMYLNAREIGFIVNQYHKTHPSLTP